MEKEYIGLYTIEDFRTEPGLGTCAYGPSIVLAGPVAEAIVKSPEKWFKSHAFNVALNETLTRSVPEHFRNGARLEFFKNTWLLTNITAGGTSSRPSCGLMGSAIGDLSIGVYENIRYQPFNIDQEDVSKAIESVWLMWFNQIIKLTSFELPYAPYRST